MPNMMHLKVSNIEALKKYFRCVKLKMRWVVQNCTPPDRVNISTFTGLRQIAEEKIDIYQNAAQKVLVISCLQVNGGIVS